MDLNDKIKQIKVLEEEFQIEKDKAYKNIISYEIKLRIYILKYLTLKDNT